MLRARKYLLVVGLLVVMFQPRGVRVALADDAAVLPKGRSSVSLENLFYFPTESRWNPHGNPEKVAGVLNERALNSSVFSLLKPLDPLVGGTASIGDAFVRFKYDFNALDLTFAYGITDRLTVGIDIPYWWAWNRVRARLNSDPGTSANVGLRIATPPAVGPCSVAFFTGLGLPATTAFAPVLPLFCPNVVPFGTEDVQQLLGPGIAGNAAILRPAIAGFGFRRIRPFFADQLGDITAVAKHQYFKNEDWRLAVTGGVRIPTGRQDDPNDLTDVSWSNGAYALLVRFHNDYVLSNLWKGRSAAATSGISQPGDLILDFTFRYDLVLPDEATLRISSSPIAPLSQRERVDRDLGDKFEIEVTGTYQVIQGLSVSALYKYGWKLEDQITGHKTFPTAALEKDTDSTEQIFIVRGTYSTLPLYLEKKFPIPVNLTVSYRDRFAGSGPRNAASPSQFLKTRYISFGVQFFF